jgi:MtaA/CmuA family methyltransferase
MNSRQRVEALFKSTEPDCVPVIPPFQGFWALDAAGLKISEAFADQMKGAEAQIKMLEKAPFDAFEVVWDWLAAVEACGCKVQIPDDGNPITMERIVKSIDDVERLRMPDIKSHKRSIDDFKIAAYLNAKYKEAHCTYATLALPFTLAGELMGVDSLMLNMMRKPDAIHKLLDYSAKVMLEYAKMAKESGVDAICWCDPTASADLISPSQFKNFAVPYIKSVVQKTREMGLKAFVHICGNTTDRLDTILDIRPDLMSVDTKVSLSKAMEVLKGKVAVLGNVSTSNMLFKSPKEIMEEAKACIAKAGKVGFALGAGCDIPIGAPVGNVRALWDAARS